MEAVDILPEVDCLDNFLLGDVRREGKLHDEAVDIGVVVKFVDGCQEFVLRKRFFRGALEANERGLEVRGAFALCHHRVDFGANLFFDLGCGSLAVDKLHVGKF